MTKNEVVRMKSREELMGLIASNRFVMLDFSAKWCGPCKHLKPSIEKLVAEYPHLKVVEVDVDRFVKVSNEFDVQAMPTLVFLESGKEKFRKTGFMEFAKLSSVAKSFVGIAPVETLKSEWLGAAISRLYCGARVCGRRAISPTPQEIE